jgi:hypothetical protein
MTCKIRLTSLLVLDWFDGPLEAVAQSTDGDSYAVRHVGDPPITSRSIYSLSPLAPGAFERLLGSASAAYGPANSPVWILPAPARDAEPDPVDRALEESLVGVPDRVGYCRTGGLLDHELDVMWLDARQAKDLSALDAEALWHAVTELRNADSRE